MSANVTNDSAVLNQNRKPSTNPTLDAFDARNGYRDGGLTVYSDSFKKAYFKAQSDRMNFLIGEALARLDEINASGDSDAPFIVPLRRQCAPVADRPHDPPRHAAAPQAREEQRHDRRQPARGERARAEPLAR